MPFTTAALVLKMLHGHDKRVILNTQSRSSSSRLSQSHAVVEATGMHLHVAQKFDRVIKNTVRATQVQMLLALVGGALGTSTLNGTSERPRLAVFRSNQHLYAQVIDDTKQHTLAASSTLSKEIREAIEDSSGPTIDAAKKVGESVGKLCVEKGISKVAFDRGGFVYHGLIKALADAAREAGLEF